MPFTPVVARDGNNASQNMAAFQSLVTAANYPAVTMDTTKSTYRYSASFTPQATAAVTLLSIVGSATRTVRIKRILLGGVSTANASVILQLQRTSALGAGGTTVNPTAALNDTLSAAASTNLVAHYTTTLKAAGTAVGGPTSTWRQFTSVVTTPTLVPSFQTIFPEHGFVGGQALVLRGVAQFYEIQLVGAGNLSAGTVLEYSIDLEEDDS